MEDITIGIELLKMLPQCLLMLFIISPPFIDWFNKPKKD